MVCALAASGDHDGSKRTRHKPRLSKGQHLCRPLMSLPLCRFSDAGNDDFTTLPAGGVGKAPIGSAQQNLGAAFRAHAWSVLLPASIRRSTDAAGAPGAVFTSR